MPNDLQDKLSSAAIIDTLYEIALDPGSLDEFIEAWNKAGLDTDERRQVLESFDEFDKVYQVHLDRADTFLKRGIATEDEADISETLASFENFAAFVIDQRYNVVAANDGAIEGFGLVVGAQIDESDQFFEMADALQDAAKSIISTPKPSQKLLKISVSDKVTPLLFQIRQLQSSKQGNENLALVITTKYHWNAVLGETLEDVFGLTVAEQNIVRSLVEGQSTKEISADRGTSEGTVRGQVKTILSKMDARTQSEVIRLVLSIRNVSPGKRLPSAWENSSPSLVSTTWWRDEVWKPFQSLVLPDRRTMEYHVMGPPTGAPVVYSHMGYCLARWHEPMIRLLYELDLRVVCPIRAGFGKSDNLDPNADVLVETRKDTLCLLQHLGIERLPYLTQGNDLMFAADFTHKHPEMISEIIGICARPRVEGDHQYSNMGKWHRFFTSTARHSPHLLHFTAKAVMALCRRVGVRAMYMQCQRNSPADLALDQDEALKAVLVANCNLLVGKESDGAQAYAMEMLVCESPWSHLLRATKDTPFWSMNGDEDPAMDVATIAECREEYPWMDFEVVQNAGQMLLFQHYDKLLPKVATAAHRSS